MTKKELQAELTGYGITFNARAKLAELFSLVNQARADRHLALHELPTGDDDTDDSADEAKDTEKKGDASDEVEDDEPGKTYVMLRNAKCDRVYKQGETVKLTPEIAKLFKKLGLV